MTEDHYEPEGSDGLDEGIALIGMAGRFPGANDVDRFWENIQAGVDSVSHFSDEELEMRPDLDAPGDEATATYVRAKGILDGVDMFDARFFGYVPREVELMDPQHRIFLECAWEALEGAGYDPDRYAGSIGVYAGCYIDTYLLANLCSDPAFLRRLVASIQVGSLQTELGNDKDYIATRVSFKLNLRGPSVTVQSACSTSLVAISHACQSLATYQSDMALAGGVTITLPQKKGYFYKEGGMLSPDGRCRAFSDEAQGTVFSNGAGVIVLKRLADAVADGDTIHAVIRGWAMNNDGGSKLSFTAPSVDGQAEVIAAAQAIANVDARTIGYIEAHGTATPLGDPIEVAGLTRAFRETTADTGFCALGSVKTNLGHLDVASGVIGVMKTALSLRDGVLPPSLYYERPNPNIDFENTPFYVNTELSPWPTRPWPRRAGVSSFGVGGTNVHLVLQEPPPASVSGSDAEVPRVLVLSAKTDTALAAMSARLADHLEAHPELRLGDVARTLQVGRRLFDYRRFVVGDSVAAVREKLREEPSPHTATRQTQSGVPVAFLFPGQGAQYPNMTARLYQTDEMFRADIDACADRLSDILGMDIRDVLYPAAGGEPEAAEKLRWTGLSQPVIFAVEYAIARRWMRLGVVPDRLAGHSVGEFVAACIAGIFGLDDALALVAERGRLMQAMPPGTMISVRAPVESVAPFLVPGLEIAVINAPSLCVVSGEPGAVPAFTAALDEEGIAWSQLRTSHAFHSAMMEPAVPKLVERMAAMRLSPPEIEIFSTATGKLLSTEEATDPEYWGRQMRNAVRFEGTVREMVHDGPRVLLETGPGQTLTTLAKQILGRRDGVTAVSSLGPLQEPGDDLAHFANALGTLWLNGVDIDWNRVADRDSRRVPLPTYPFERKRFWVDPIVSEGSSSPEPVRSGHPAHGIPLPAATRDEGPSGVEQIIETQIAIMRQQLETLAKL